MQAAQPPAQKSLRARVSHFIPIIEWLPTYQPTWLRFDILAGLTLGAFTIPEAIAYASLAGVPAAAGLYTSLMAMIVYTLFGTSKHAAVGATSALAILVGGGVAALNIVDPNQYVQLMALLTIMVGVVGIIAYIVRLGFIVNFMSEPVLTGFSAGAALYIAATQLPKLFGVEGGGDDFFERVWAVITELGQTNVLALVIGLVGIAALYIGEKRFGKLPVALIVVLAAGLLVAVTGISDQLETIGVIPQGLPSLSIPPISFESVQLLLPIALAAFLLAYVEGMSAVRSIAEKHKERVDPNQELLALGMSNIASGLAGGTAVGPSLSRSAVGDAAGGKTQLAGLFGAVFIGIVIVFLPSLFANVPESILAAVVIIAVRSLFNVKALRKLFEVSRRQFWIAMVAMAGVLLFGMLEGIMLGVIVSLLNLLARISYPRTLILGRVPGTEQFVDVGLRQDAEKPEGILVYRVDGDLFFANAGNVHDEVMALAKQENAQIVVFDLMASPRLDISAAEMFFKLHENLAFQGIKLRLANVHEEALTLLNKLEPAVAKEMVGANESVAHIVDNESPSIA